MNEFENPYQSPRVGPISADARKIPFLWRLVLVSGLVLPYLVPIGFYRAYQPINERWTVKRFGCGCPSLDGTYHFNANHFNLILVGLLDLFCIPWWALSATRIFPEKTRLFACFLGIMVIMFISLYILAKMIWL